MGFSPKQIYALKRNVKVEQIRTRNSNGRELSYLEGAHIVSEANRIFGFDGWDRETLDARCVMTRESRGTFVVLYTCRVRITVRADGEKIVRDGHGLGEGRGTAPEAHELAIKTSETDATKRALITFGKPFGLSLYSARPVKTGSEEALNKSPATKLLSSAPGSTDIQTKKLNDQRIDKSVLKFGEVRRHRDRNHLKFVASQGCLLCNRQPSDPHHLRFAQPRALGLKVSDQFTVPLCREHHRQLHQSGNENAWWHDMGIEPLETSKTLWEETNAKRRLNSDPSTQG